MRHFASGAYGEWRRLQKAFEAYHTYFSYLAGVLGVGFYSCLERNRGLYETATTAALLMSLDSNMNNANRLAAASSAYDAWPLS